MKRLIIVLFLLLFTFFIGGPVFAKSALTLTPAKEDKTAPLRCEVKETGQRLQAVIHFTAPPDKKKSKKDEPTGGDYQVFLNGLPLAGASFSGTGVEKNLDIPSASLRNGQHVLRCELRSSSGAHTAERTFSFDGSPTLTLAKPTIDKNGLLDATVSLGFFGAGDAGVTGFLDVLIDERPVAQARLTEKPSGATPLSRLLGKPVAVSQLPTGVHLLTLRATGANGAATLARTTFTVEALPELTIKTDKAGKLFEAEAHFLPVADGYAGNVEVWVDHDLLLSRPAKKETVVITRDELLEALKKRERVNLSQSFTLVLALRAMNASERWQAVEFVP